MPHVRQPMHRHEARLVVFVRGTMIEDTIGGRSTFRAGDFVFRPDYFAHADMASSDGASYIHLRVSAIARARWVSRNGWCVARGRVDLSNLPDGEAALLDATPHLYDRLESTSTLRSAASLLRSPGIRVGDVAAAMDLEPHEFCRRFITSFGMSPTTYRRQARLQSAIKMLAERSASLAHIAASCGYHDQSHLTHDIRRETGCTPRDLAIPR